MYKFVKRFFDIVLSLAGIAFSLPFWLVAVIGIQLSDPGPVFYVARRVGKDNKEFRMYKFRSMRLGVANETVFRGDEERIFPFGHFIRNTKIDELPQLINILNGTMSIVGPRPAAVGQMEITRGGQYAILGCVPAGLTGPSALYDYIYGDRIQDAENYEQLVLPTRLALDLLYLKRRSLIFDLRMIIWTVICILCQLLHREPRYIYKTLVAWAQKEEMVA